MFFLIAGLNLVFGVVSCGLHVDMLGEMGIGDFSLVPGVIFLDLRLHCPASFAACAVCGHRALPLDTLLGLALTAGAAARRACSTSYFAA